MKKVVKKVAKKVTTLDKVVTPRMVAREFDRQRKFTFGQMMDMVHQTAVIAGWYVNPKTGKPKRRNFGEVIALMHSELSEALEADRKGMFDKHLPHRSGVEVELADCVIRIFDTARALGLDLTGAVIEKNYINMHRADHKLANRKRAGGVKY